MTNAASHQLDANNTWKTAIKSPQKNGDLGTNLKSQLMGPMILTTKSTMGTIIIVPARTPIAEAFPVWRPDSVAAICASIISVIYVNMSFLFS